MIRAGIYTKVYDPPTKVQAAHPNKGWPRARPPLIIPGTYCTAANRAPGLPGNSFTGHAKEYPWTPTRTLIPPGAATSTISLLC